MIGLLACVVLGYGAFFTGAEGLMRRSAYTAFAATSAGLMLASGLIAMLCTARLRDRGHTARDAPSIKAFIHDVGEVFRNPSFRVLFASAVFFFLAQAISVSANLHANTFFWRLSGGEAQLVTLSSLGGLVIGAPILTPFAVRLEKRTALLIGLFGWVAVQAGLPLVRLLGGLQMPHGPLALVLAGNAVLGGLALSMAAIAFISMMADAADEHEFLFAKRREGLYFAGWAFASKAANGVGALIAGVALQLIGFPQDLASHGGLHAVLAPEVVQRLGILVGPGAGVASLIGIVVLWGYKLDRKRHADLLATLTERRRAVD
jgi:GPH family glycoside/pentoside/hexuronide:cation symporter